ncbi:putative pantoate--beta-alanine ligase [unidentified eubacterium SCB49]|nr:putative pantoate--beta-alanine ligase [unidentified eubacterium SCB49]
MQFKSNNLILLFYENIPMNIYKTQTELQSFISDKMPETVGFVPTMGALHDGHLELVKKALEENEVCVVSIFVNPTQFDNASDLKKYPRTLHKDAALLKQVSDKILVYAPDAKDLYGDKVQSAQFDFGPIAKEMEGAFRHGHFDGVGTVVSLLFDAVKPSAAYFGEKDFQQLQIIKKLVEIKQYDIRIVGCDIVREPSGLARSSRNTRLSALEFEKSTLIYKTLKHVKNQWNSLSIEELNQYVASMFSDQKMFDLEYFVIANEETLKTAHTKSKKDNYRAFIVVFVGDVRLIDNIYLGKG